MEDEDGVVSTSSSEEDDEEDLLERRPHAIPQKFWIAEEEPYKSVGPQTS
jgi:hypothetical protein